MHFGINVLNCFQIGLVSTLYAENRHQNCLRNIDAVTFQLGNVCGKLIVGCEEDK